ncbi:acyl-CoA dehydrogenase N-terminal domain-containing protein [Nocardia abscessus]
MKPSSTGRVGGRIGKGGRTVSHSKSNVRDLEFNLFEVLR